MLSIISIVLSSVCIILLVICIYLLFKNKMHGEGTDSAKIEETIKSGFQSQSDMFYKINELMLSSIKNYNDNVINSLTKTVSLQSEQFNHLQNKLDNILKSNEEKLQRAIDVIGLGLKELTLSNEKKLDEMRGTVDEKLSVSLEKRLTESFNVINSRLQSVYEGLGEMKQLATGVGDLKKVLTNVKTRGVYGEIGLGNILTQMLAPSQFASNVQIKDNSQERVDYAVIMPGKDGEIILPIDAKFPIEDYQRLVEASDNGDKIIIDSAVKGIERRVKEEAKKIHDKYIDIPKTTDFAIMYLAIEGLYAEVLKRAGLVEQLQREYKIIICGPTTITAILSSLQLGFKTLAIEKRSSEVWNLLSTFKKEFSNFTMLLSKTQKKLEEASGTIEDAAKKTKTIERKLKSVSELGSENEELESKLIELRHETDNLA